jgi:hypothetical protein
MPQIQVLGREAIDDQNNQANQAIEKAKMAQNAFDKSMQFKQMNEQLKLMAKNTDNEIEKIKVQRLGDRMSYMANIFKSAMDSPNPESVIKTALQLGGADMMKDLSDPLVQDMIKKLQPSGDTAQKQAVADTLNSPMIRKQLGYSDAQPAGAPGQAPQATTQAQTNVLAGNTPTQSGYSLGPEIGINAGPVDLKLINQDSLNKMTTAKEIATNTGQPLSDNVANAVAFQEEAKPVFADMYTKVDDLIKHGDSMGWFGGVKINAGTETGPGQSMLRFGEFDKQRELALQLNKIKQIAFTYGGKTLSDTERNLVFSALSPVNKYPSQWKKDLQWAERRLNRAAQLQTTPQGQAFKGNITQPGVITDNTPANNANDPLGLFGGK